MLVSVLLLNKIWLFVHGAITKKKLKIDIQKQLSTILE